MCVFFGGMEMKVKMETEMDGDGDGSDIPANKFSCIMIHGQTTIYRIGPREMEGGANRMVSLLTMFLFW